MYKYFVLLISVVIMSGCFGPTASSNMLSRNKYMINSSGGSTADSQSAWNMKASEVCRGRGYHVHNIQPNNIVSSYGGNITTHPGLTGIISCE